MTTSEGRNFLRGEEVEARLKAIRDATDPVTGRVDWDQVTDSVNAWRREHDLEPVQKKSLYYWYRYFTKRHPVSGLQPAVELPENLSLRGLVELLQREARELRQEAEAIGARAERLEAAATRARQLLY